MVTFSPCPYRYPPTPRCIPPNCFYRLNLCLCIGCLGKPPLSTWLCTASTKRNPKATRTLKFWMGKEDQQSKKTISLCVGRRHAPLHSVKNKPRNWKGNCPPTLNSEFLKAASLNVCHNLMAQIFFPLADDPGPPECNTLPAF